MPHNLRSPMKCRFGLAYFFWIGACGTGVVGDLPSDSAADGDAHQPDASVDASIADAKPAVDDAPADSVVADVGGTCYDRLTAHGINYKKTTARGVVDAVNVTDAVINGVGFHATTTSNPLTDPIACEFVLTLYDLAAVLKKHNVVSVGSLGSYCYRCCCAWSETNFCRGLNDPEPDCTKDGYSTHSWGRAIDIRYIKFVDGTSADINTTTDWVQSTDATCDVAMAKQTGMSAKLYSILCEAASIKIFENLLTPNYNSAHRNHWHLDTDKSGPVTSTFVKGLNNAPLMSQPARVDTGDQQGSCGDE